MHLVFSRKFKLLVISETKQELWENFHFISLFIVIIGGVFLCFSPLSKKRWEHFYLHLILICVKCTIFFSKIVSFFFFLPSLPLIHEILIFSLPPQPRCQSFFQTSYIKSKKKTETFFFSFHFLVQQRNSFNFTSNSVGGEREWMWRRRSSRSRKKNINGKKMKKKEKHDEECHRYFTICWCTSKSFQAFANSFFTLNQIALETKVDFVDTKRLSSYFSLPSLSHPTHRDRHSMRWKSTLILFSI